MTFSRTRAVIFLAVLGLLANAGIANAAIVNYNIYSMPSSITGLSVDGNTYDVSIYYDSFNHVFNGITPTFWGDQTGASDAATVMAALLQANGVGPTQFTQAWVSVPYSWGVTSWVALYDASLSPRWSPVVLALPASSTSSNVGYAVFASASPSVPEPSTLLVWSGLGAIGAVMAYRRKRRAA
jgi:hypothetical protein